MSYDAYLLYQIELVKGPGKVLRADERAACQRLVSAVLSLFRGDSGLYERSGDVT